MTTESATAEHAYERARPTRDLTAKPVVIEARGVSKTFRIPEQRVDTLKERATHLFRHRPERLLVALRDISFEVHRGEFFGIVGRNGSGKSTLLKILASIYRADSGRVRLAGRMAPFIELGVGFNPELTARANCELNGVLMGLSRREAKRRLDTILDFAELREFADLKVKNYSSGMMVRLAFSIMVQADADIMLIDEVLAVGDAAFAQKCMEFFHRQRDAGKTIVLVTHDMSTVQSMCHRAMVIDDSRVEYVGDPQEAALHYLRLNFGAAAAEVIDPDLEPSNRPIALEVNARLLDATLRNEAGEPIANVEQEEPIVLDARIEAVRELDNPIFVFHVRNLQGLVVFSVTRTLEEVIHAGQHVRLRGEIDNRLVPGSYTLDVWIRRDGRVGDIVVQPMRVLSFVVYGTAPRHGVVTLHTSLEAELETDG